MFNVELEVLRSALSESEPSHSLLIAFSPPFCFKFGRVCRHFCKKKSRKICIVHNVKSRVRDSFVKMHSDEPEILSNSHALTLRKVRSKMASKRAAAIAAPDLAFVQPPNSFIVKFSAIVKVF